MAKRVFPDEIKVSVTEFDIANSKPGCPEKCVVANGVKNALKTSLPICVYEAARITVYNRGEYSSRRAQYAVKGIKARAVINKLIWDFDNNKKVTPKTFTITKVFED